MREAFAAALREVETEGAERLLDAMASGFEPPLTEADLPDTMGARSDMLTEWDRRMAVLWLEWQSHPQRLRPLRELMEQGLLRAYAALTNELRQRALGITRYVWRSRDDARVRSAHAAYDDQIFAWDAPPEGGHPGQAHNCRCWAEPVVDDASTSFDGFALRNGETDRGIAQRSAEAEMQALQPALETLASLDARTEQDDLEHRALAALYVEAAYRYELASPRLGGLARSDLLIGLEAEQERLVAEAEAFRQGADDLARGMVEAEFFDGIDPSQVVDDLRLFAPQSADRYLDAVILLAGVRHLPDGPARQDALEFAGARLVATARAVEEERWGGRPFVFRADVRQWDALHAELQRIASDGASREDVRAVERGMREETGRRFLPEALSLISGGVFAALGRAAPRPIRITADMLDARGAFLGQRNAGAQAPRFSTWLSRRPEAAVEIMPGGQVRYTTRISDPASRFDGQLVSVSYTNGVPDFSPHAVIQINIPAPVGRVGGANPKADLVAATQALRTEVEAGRVNRSLFNAEQLEAILRGDAQIPDLSWHHDGLILNPDGTGPMLLVDFRTHQVFRHQGWASRVGNDE